MGRKLIELNRFVPYGTKYFRNFFHPYLVPVAQYAYLDSPVIQIFKFQNIPGTGCINVRPEDRKIADS